MKLTQACVTQAVFTGTICGFSGAVKLNKSLLNLTSLSIDEMNFA